MAGKRKQQEDLSALDIPTLQERAGKARKELVMLRISRKSGGNKNPMSIHHMRKQIARILTVVRQKEMTHAPTA